MEYRHKLDNDETVIKFLSNYEMGNDFSELTAYASIATFAFAERLAVYQRLHLKYKIMYASKYMVKAGTFLRGGKKATIKDIENSLMKEDKELITLMDEMLEAEMEMEKYKSINQLLSNIMMASSRINT